MKEYVTDLNINESVFLYEYLPILVYLVVAILLSVIIISISYLLINESVFLYEYLPILVYLVVAILLSVIIISISHLLVLQNPETLNKITKNKKNLLHKLKIFHYYKEKNLFW